MAGQTGLPGELGLRWTRALGLSAHEGTQLLTLVLLQVGFFPSECVELFTERPGPGLKAGKYHGEWAGPSPSAYHLSFLPLFTHRC